MNLGVVKAVQQKLAGGGITKYSRQCYYPAEGCVAAAAYAWAMHLRLVSVVFVWCLMLLIDVYFRTCLALAITTKVVITVRFTGNESGEERCCVCMCVCACGSVSDLFMMVQHGSLVQFGDE